MNSNSVAPFSDANGLVDLKVLFLIVWRKKLIIFVSTIIVAVSAAIITLLMPNYYKSSALLAPTSESSGGGLAALAGQFGGLASLAGVNLGSGEENKTALAMEVFKSRTFILEFIERRNILKELMATSSWDSTSNQLVYDSSLIDPVTGEWKKSEGESLKPPNYKILKRYLKLIQINEDKKTGFVTISVTFLSPYTAQKWTEWLVDDLNAEIREREVVEAKKNISYLTKQLENTHVAELKTVFHSLIEEHVKTMMFAESREDYVFKVIDPAFAPERKSSPRRSVIVILSLLFALVISICACFVMEYVRASKAGGTDAG